MAGTRLLVHSSFLIEIILLALLSFYVCRDEYIVNRSGLFGLEDIPVPSWSSSISPQPPQDDVDGEWTSLLAFSSIPKTLPPLPISIRLYVSVVKDEEDDGVLDGIAKDFQNYITSYLRTRDGGNNDDSDDESIRIVNVEALQLSDWTFCDNDAADTTATQCKNNSNEEQDDGYYSIVMLSKDKDECSTKLVSSTIPPTTYENEEVHTERHEASGAILVHTTANLLDDDLVTSDIVTLITPLMNKVAKSIVDTVLLPSTVPSSSSSKVLEPWYHFTMTLLDQDPQSHEQRVIDEIRSSSDANFGREYHLTMAREFTKAVNDQLLPLVHKLSPLIDVTVSSRTSMYQSLSSLSSSNAGGYKRRQIPTTKLEQQQQQKASSNVLSTWYQQQHVKKSSSSKLDFSTVDLSALEPFLHRSMHSTYRYSHASSSSSSSSRLHKDNAHAHDDSMKDDVTPKYMEFVTYIPASQYTPLFINNDDDDGNHKVPPTLLGDTAYIPNQGGVSILNIAPFSADDSTIDNNESLHQIMESFISQIRNVVGLSSSHHPETDNNDVSEWEIQALLRYWLPNKYQATMKDLNDLLQWMEQNQNLPVTTQVGHKIQTTIIHLQNAYLQASYSLQGHTNHTTTASTTNSYQKLSTAMRHINSAQLILQSIHTDSTMLEPQYLPPEHVLAVFSPLFLPLLLPLVLGFIREFKRYKKLMKKKEEDEGEGEDKENVLEPKKKNEEHESETK